MRETFEFRIPEDRAKMYLPSGCGKDLGGTVRKVVLDSRDPLVAEIARLEKQCVADGKAFFHGWTIHRHYSRHELHTAALFFVFAKRVFEPAGEECGTVYDESKACPECGVGALQTTPLFLNGSRIPRKVDFAGTIAREVVVSRRVVDLFRENGLRGAEFQPIRLSNKHGIASENHFQLTIVGPRVELDVTRTKAGSALFDESGYGRCSQGHVAGLNLLSAVTVQRQTVPDADIMATRQMVGVRRGLLRPRPLLLLSPKALNAIEAAKLGGLTVEVAHLV